MSTETTSQFAIPKGSRVVVTGANGFIASHVVKQLLENGYKVYPTVLHSGMVTLMLTVGRSEALSAIPKSPHGSSPSSTPVMVPMPWNSLPCQTWQPTERLTTL
jgi:hypothetical protein